MQEQKGEKSYGPYLGFGQGLGCNSSGHSEPDWRSSKRKERGKGGGLQQSPVIGKNWG